jgi:hypothetical protein
MTPPVAGAALRARHAEAAPLRLPPAPRRVSGPSRHPRATPATPATRTSLLLRLIDHPWLERLVRGRAWIAIVATALLGIVAMQVALLRLGAQIGSETSAVNALTAQNETTQTELAVMEASHRLSRAAASLRMVYPAPGAVTYLQAYEGDAARAARTMTVPSGAAIAAAAADAIRPATLTPVTPPPATTPVSTPATTTTPAAGAGTTAATTAAGTTPAGTTTAGTTAAGTTTAGTTTAGTTAAGTTTAGTTAAGTPAAATTAPGTTATGTTPGTTSAGTTSAGTTSAGTTQTQTSGTGAPTTTTAGAGAAPATTTAGGTTPGQ